MPSESGSRPRFLRRLDRLGASLALASVLAVVGSFAAMLAIATAAIALIDSVLVTVPPAWGGAAGLLLAAAAGCWVWHQYPMPSTVARRLLTCRRLEQGMPALGERLSRSVGLLPADPRASSSRHLETVHESLRQAALADAEAALAAVPCNSWLWRQTETQLAVVSLLLASVGWAGLCWSWAQGPDAWRASLASQYWEPTAPDVIVADAAGSSPRPMPLSTSEAMRQVYEQTLAANDAWQKLLSEEHDSSSVEHAAAVNQLRRVAAEAVAWAAETDEDAVVLRHFANGLARVVEHAANDQPPAVLVDELAAMLEAANAAAGIAEAAEATRVAGRALQARAASSAGRVADELPLAGREWRRATGRDLQTMAVGVSADIQQLQHASLLTEESLPVSVGQTVADMLTYNRLFTAARELSRWQRGLAATAGRLGMPPLERTPPHDVAAVARRRLIAFDVTRADGLAAGDVGQVDSVATEQTPRDATGEKTSVVAIVSDAVSPSEGGDAVAVSTPTVSGGEPGGGSGSAAATSSDIQGRPRTPPTNVWIPAPADPPQTTPVPASPPEPAVSPEYFRKLLGGFFGQATSSLRRHQRGLTTALAALSLTVAVGESEASADPPDSATASAAVERGLAWLVAAQQPDGSWGSERFRGSVAVTAHGVLALASTGSTGLAGPHADAVERGIAFLLAHASSDGLIAANESSAHGPMYGHAYAVQALAELAGESGQAELIATLRRGCRLIEQTQNEAGGWRYQPRRADADISVTAAMVVALEAASAAGVAVSETTVERAVAYLLMLQNPDGGFRYHTSEGVSAPPRTAAALVALALTAPEEAEPLAAGRAWLREHPSLPDPSDGYAAYGTLASSIAAWQAGPEVWASWYAATAGSLLDLQRGDGAWPDPSCAEYGTAAAILSLTTANGLLPGWKRGETP